MAVFRTFKHGACNACPTGAFSLLFRPCIQSGPQWQRRRNGWKVAASTMSSIPYTMHSAVQLHRRLAEDQQPKDVNVIFEPPTSTVETTLAKYNPKLMNSIWGLYNRYAPHSFQKNCEIAGCPVSGLTDAREKSFGLSLWNRLH